MSSSCHPRARPWSWPTWSLIAVLALAACGSPEPTARPSESPEQDTAAHDYDGEWRLKSGRGPAGRVRMPEQATLEVSGRRLAGATACNSFYGRARISGTAFKARRLLSTAMGCQPRWARAEQQYLEALQAATTIERDGERLRLSGDGVALVYVPVTPPPTAEFEDTAWRLESLAFGSDPDSMVTSTMAAAEARFANDETFTATTGCREVSGRWERDGETITVSGLPDDDVDCPDGAGRQDDHVMAVLRVPFTGDVEGQRLWLQQVDGDLGLDYRAD